MAGRTTSVTISGTRRSLLYDVNAFAELEAQMSMGIGQILAPERVGFQVVRNLLWAGLLHEMPGATPSVVGTLLQEHVEGGGDLVEMFGACTDAITRSSAALAFGMSGEDEEEEGTADVVPLDASASATG